MKKINKVLILATVFTGVLNASVFSYNKNSNYNVVLESQRLNRANQIAKEINSLYNFGTLYILETGDENINLDKIVQYFKLNKKNYKNYFKDGYLKIFYLNGKIQISNILTSKGSVDLKNINNIYISNAIKKDIENILIQNISLLTNGEGKYTISISEPNNLKIFNTLKKIYSAYPECQNAKFSIEINPKINSKICKLNGDGTADLYIYSKGKHIFVKKLYIYKNFFNSGFLVSSLANIAKNETADGKKINNLVPGTIVLVYDNTKPVNERVLTPLVYTGKGWVGKNWAAINFKTALASKTNLLINLTNKANDVPIIGNYSDNTNNTNNENIQNNANNENAQNNTNNENVQNNTNNENAQNKIKLNDMTETVTGIPSSLHVPSYGWILFAHIVGNSSNPKRVGFINDNMKKDTTTSYILNNTEWSQIYNKFDQGMLLKDSSGRIYYISKDKLLFKKLPSGINGKCSALPKTLTFDRPLFHVEDGGCNYTGTDYSFIFLGNTKGQFVRQSSKPVFDYWPVSGVPYVLYGSGDYLNYYIHVAGSKLVSNNNNNNNNSNNQQINNSNQNNNNQQTQSNNVNNNNNNQQTQLNPVKYGNYTFYDINELNVAKNKTLAKKVFQGNIAFGSDFVRNGYAAGGDQGNSNQGIEIPLMNLPKNGYIRLKLKLNCYGNYYKDYFAIYNKKGNLIKSFYTYGNGATNGVRTPHEEEFYMYIPVYEDAQRIHISEAWSQYIYLYDVKVVNKVPSAATTDGLKNVVIESNNNNNNNNNSNNQQINNSNQNNNNQQTQSNNVNNNNNNQQTQLNPVKYGNYTFYDINELNVAKNKTLAKKVFQGNIAFGSDFVRNGYAAGGDQGNSNQGIEIPLMNLPKNGYIRLKLKLNCYGNYYKDYFAIYNKKGNLIKSFYTYGNGATNGVRTPHEEEFYMYIPVYEDAQRIHISEAWSQYIYLYDVKVVNKVPSAATTDGLKNVVIK